MYSYWNQFRSVQYSPEFIQELERRANAPQVYINTTTMKKIVVSANQLALRKESRDFRILLLPISVINPAVLSMTLNCFPHRPCVTRKV